MKKFVALLLALLMCVVPIAKAYQHYPTVDHPQIWVETVWHDDSWWSLMEDFGLSQEALTMILTEHYIIGDCKFDCAVWVDCGIVSGPVTFEFYNIYAPYELVCGILLQPPYTYVLWTHGNEDGSVTYDWPDIQSDVYLMLIFSGWQVH